MDAWIVIRVYRGFCVSVELPHPGLFTRVLQVILTVEAVRAVSVAGL